MQPRDSPSVFIVISSATAATVTTFFSWLAVSVAMRPLPISVAAVPAFLPSVFPALWFRTCRNSWSRCKLLIQQLVPVMRNR